MFYFQQYKVLPHDYNQKNLYTENFDPQSYQYF